MIKIGEAKVVQSNPLTEHRSIYNQSFVTQAGIYDTHYAGHSFRIGTATTAAAKDSDAGSESHTT